MGKSPISRSEAEAKGWQIVHESEEQGLYRAEKIFDGAKVEQSGRTEGTLLEAINSYEEHRAGLPEFEAAPVTESGELVDEAGLTVRPVLGPDGMEMTDSEWTSRDRAEAIVRDEDEGFHFEGGSEVAQEAAEIREEIAADQENQVKAEPDNGPTEQIMAESSRDHQLEDVLVVREGEESLGEVIDRKLEESAQEESDRVEAGLGIGGTNFERQEDGEMVPVPMGGEPAEFVLEGSGPGGSELAAAEVRQEAEVAKAEELRDEHGKQADKPELAAEVTQAGSDAQQELADSKQEEADESSSDEEVVDPGDEPPAQNEQPQEGDIEASPAAKKLAEEKGVDLSKVSAKDAGGKITKPDVESYLEADEKK